MDYPHPQIELTKGKISLDKAYAVGIGEWDKAAITWGYQDFPDGTDEEKALDQLIEDQIKDDLYFITDADARPLGSSHPFSHLWDNGKSAADELNRLMEVRAAVLNDFSEKNIPQGAPMATLEEVLVPMYMLHRYQLEGAVKAIGGTYYNYKLRGDSQANQRVVPRAEQEAALQALLNTVAPENLAFPSHVIKMIPPRPPGFGRSRETFKVRSGLNFDPVTPGETIASAVMSFIFHPQRATRLVQQKALDPNQLGLMDVIEIINNAVNAVDSDNGYYHELNRVVIDQFTSALMNLASNSQASSSARAVAMNQLIEWSNYEPNESDPLQQAFMLVQVHKINQFLEEPMDFQPIPALSPPDGSPIGSDLMDWCHFHDHHE
jgi:hypothetical protein